MPFFAYVFLILTPVDISSVNSTQYDAGAQNVGVTMNPGTGDWLTGTHSWRYSLDGQEWISTSDSTFWLNGLASGEHVLNVSAVDAAGNWDPHPRQIKWVTWPLASYGTAALTLETAPTNTSTTSTVRFGGWSKELFRWRLDAGPWTTSRGSPNISVTVSAGQPHFLEALPGAQDDGLLWAPPFNTMWTPLEGSSVLLLSNLHDGAHRIVVKAVDAAGNLDPGNQTRSWTVDTVPPTVCSVVAVQRDGDTCAEGKTTLSSQCVLNVSSHGEAISRVVALLDGTTEVRADVRSGGSDNSVFLTAGVSAEGAHALQVWVMDLAGNLSPQPCASWTWTYDPSMPEAILLNQEQLPSITASNVTFFQVQRNREGVTVRWRLDEGVWQDATDGVLVDRLAVAAGEGKHVLALRAEDSFGNLVETPDAWNWTVDLTGPVSTIDGPPAVLTHPNSTFSFNCTSKAVGSLLSADCQRYQYVVTKQGSGCPEEEGTLLAVDGNVSTFVDGLVNGFYTITVRAVDLAGNVQKVAAQHNWTVALPVVLYDVNITSGPPETYGLPSAVLYFYAYLGSQRVTSGVAFEVKLNEVGYITGMVC